MTSQQRVKNVSDELKRRLMHRPGVDYDDLAWFVLEAADRVPLWPTDESVRIAYGDYDVPDDMTERRGKLRAALVADPIIKAAVAYREYCWPQGPAGAHAKAVTDAVDQAGL